jgi:hypothetical protein
VPVLEGYVIDAGEMGHLHLPWIFGKKIRMQNLWKLYQILIITIENTFGKYFSTLIATGKSVKMPLNCLNLSL